MSRRRQYVIDRKYQFRFGAAGAVYILAVCVCLAAVTVPLLTGVDRVLTGMSGPDAAALRQHVATAKLLFGIVTAIMVAVWFIAALLRAHKIAGPVYNIARVLNRVKAGETDIRVRLRKGDDLQAVANGINDVLDSLHARDDAIRARIKELAWTGDGLADPVAHPERAVSFVFNNGNGNGSQEMPEYVKPSGPPRVPERI